jgi:hypothetical protein
MILGEHVENLLVELLDLAPGSAEPALWCLHDNRRSSHRWSSMLKIPGSAAFAPSV